MSAAAVIARRRRRLIRKFRDAGATDPCHTTTPEMLGERHSWIFDRLVRRGVFQSVPDGTYYLDEPAADEYQRRRRTRALIITGIMLGVFLVLWASGLLSR